MSQYQSDNEKQPNSLYFLDKCHKYGWAITLFGTIIFQLLFYGYTAGQFKQKADDFGGRLGRLEGQMDAIMLKLK